jgi:ubiquinone biosynthesis protein
MKLSASHLKRYQEIASLFWRYGRSDLVKQMGVDEDDLKKEQREKENGDVSPEHLADDLEAMGPTYIKLGQVLAGRPDLLPQAYRDALERLQDKVKPFPYEDVERIIEQELGGRISKLFSHFDREPMAAASLGQVHKAALRDGRAVVVKIQRPEIRPRIAEDFEVLAQLAHTLDAHTKIGKRYHFATMVDEFHLTIVNELNYEREAQNMITIGDNLAEFANIQVPQPVMDYTTRSVLTMEYVRGHKITSLTPLARLDVDGHALCDELFRAYLKQVVVDGIFHADPHPGNVFLTNENRVALLDLGMVGRTTPNMQQSLLKVLLAISDGNGDDVAETVIQVSDKTEEFGAAEFRRKIRQLVAQSRDKGLAQLKVGASLLEVCRNAAQNGLVVPSELTMLGKTLMQLDEIGRILAPDFDPNAAVRRNVEEYMTQRVQKDISKGNILSSILEMKSFLGALPTRLNRIMDAVTNSELELKVKAVDAKVVMEGMQKIANRITTGLVLAALIVGASLLMRVETAFTIFGYPGLAILCFVIAAGGGFYLVISILWQDYKSRKNIKR